MAAKIGIKLADGTFFPIMNDDSSAAETLELTTVRDNQQSVQINLFKKEHEDSEPSYVGSLIVEDIQEKGAGEPTIELHLSLDEEKNLSAEALDTDSGTHQTLHVSLETFDEHTFDGIDFDLNSEIPDTAIDEAVTNKDIDSFGENYQNFSTIPFYTDDDDNDKSLPKKRGIPIWLLILLILLGLASLTLGVLLLTKKNLSENNEPVIAQSDNTSAPLQERPSQETAAPAAEPALPADEPVTEPPTPQSEIHTGAAQASPSIANNAVANDTPTQETTIQQAKTTVHNKTAQSTQASTPSNYTAQYKEKKPDAAPIRAARAAEVKKIPDSKSTKPTVPVSAQNAIRYQLRWGDTLWDISETYYRNPWLYRKIAEYNNLSDPNNILSGTYIEIPPQ